jgi:hypothetical protein
MQRKPQRNLVRHYNFPYCELLSAIFFPNIVSLVFLCMNSGDGICCDYGEGRYNLYDGDVSNNILLASGGKYELMESTIVQPGREQSTS